jgi:hypothetical protein
MTGANPSPKFHGDMTAYGAGALDNYSLLFDDGMKGPLVWLR